MATPDGASTATRFSKAAMLRYSSLLIMTLQNTALAISMQYSRTVPQSPPPAPGQPVVMEGTLSKAAMAPINMSVRSQSLLQPEGKMASLATLGRTKLGKKPKLYLVTTAVVCAEVMKFFISIVLALQQMDSSGLMQELMGSDAVKMLVPAGLYTVQNNLQYYAVGNLDASVCQVLYQMKLVTTALFTTLILGRQLSGRQWAGIVICAMGVAVVQLSNFQAESGSAGGQSATKQLLGFLAIMVSTLSSGFAAVYTEKIFKTVTVNIWVKNAQLALWSVGIGAAAVILNDGPSVMEYGFFTAYTPQVWCTIVLQAFGGIVVAIVVRFADSVAKGFATGLSLVGTCALSAFIFNFVVTPAYLTGTALVLFSIYAYSSSSSPPPTPQSSGSANEVNHNDVVLAAKVIGTTSNS